MEQQCASNEGIPREWDQGLMKRAAPAAAHAARRVGQQRGLPQADQDDLRQEILLAVLLGLGPLAERIPLAVLAGILVKVGVDIIDWNAGHQITRFKVMVRPLRAVNTLHEMMRKMLEAGGA